jgi:hypothetical protein
MEGALTYRTPQGHVGLFRCYFTFTFHQSDKMLCRKGTKQKSVFEVNWSKMLKVQLQQHSAPKCNKAGRSIRKHDIVCTNMLCARNTRLRSSSAETRNVSTVLVGDLRGNLKAEEV